MSGQAIKNIVLAILSAIGGFIVEHIGGIDKMLIALLIFMAVDYITGLMVAFFFHKSTKTQSGGASSKEGFKGILKKICILLLVGLAHELDYIMGIDYTRALAILFFLGNEGLSILENMGLMGVKYPEFIKKALEVIKDKGDSGGDSDEDV
jgi:toxin secretion/phage lysis holin